jgi:uncharacterized protein (TIGR03089 family)
MANWVAKTHFLLTDGLGLGIGDAALVDLPAHWISVPVLFGCWSAGLAVVHSAATAAVAFVQPATLESADGVPDVFAIAPDTAASGFGDTPPAGAQDYVAAVRPQPDTWATVHSPGGPLDPALGKLTRVEVAELAHQRAIELGLAPGARVMSERTWSDTDDWIDTLLAPLAVGASIVLVAHADPSKHAIRVEQERVTAII